MDVVISPISTQSLTWLKSTDFFRLYKQLTECTELEQSKI